MPKVSFEIDDEFIDGLSLTRMSRAFNGGKWEAHVSHRIGSVKDDFGRPLGKYTSGKGYGDTAETALADAMIKFDENVTATLAEQNAKPPQPPKGLTKDEDDLFKLLDL